MTREKSEKTDRTDERGESQGKDRGIDREAVVKKRKNRGMRV